MKINKSLIIKIVLISVVVVSVGAVLFVNGQRSKRYEMAEKSFIGMDTVITAKIYGDTGREVHLQPIQNLVIGLEEKISRFKKDSEIFRLNKGEKITDTTVYSTLIPLKKFCEETDGAFDFTVGKLSDLWGIDSDKEEIPSQQEIEKVLKSVDYTKITDNGLSVSFDGKGEVDLGAVGKGIACDMIKTYLETTEVKGAVVSVGGSILAYGDYNKKGEKWSIAIRHPRNENEFLGIIKLAEGFVSTSGDYERYFEKDGIRYHHIFDARTGYPASSGLISVTVVASTGMLSDALSTACFILGAEESKALLEKYSASAVFVDEEMNITTVGEIDFEKK